MNPILTVTILLALLSWLIVPYITDERAIRRERASKRSEFLAFLNKWRTEVFSCRKRMAIGTGPVEEAYNPKLPEFNAARSRVQDAFIDSQTFAQLADRLGSFFGKRDWRDEEARKEILEALDRLIEFAKENPKK